MPSSPTRDVVAPSPTRGNPAPVRPNRIRRPVFYARRRRPVFYAREERHRPSSTREERRRPVNLRARNAFTNGRSRHCPVFHSRRTAGRGRLATSRWIILLLLLLLTACMQTGRTGAGFPRVGDGATASRVGDDGVGSAGFQGMICKRIN